MIIIVGVRILHDLITELKFSATKEAAASIVYKLDYHSALMTNLMIFN